jgi:hypothetical protein
VHAGQLQPFAQLQCQAQMTVMDRREGAAENADGRVQKTASGGKD